MPLSSTTDDPAEVVTAPAQDTYTVELARSGRTLQVRAGETLLECIEAAGIDVLYSCRSGICGTCEVAVLEGLPDHQDVVLSDEERAGNHRMMICCSGSRSARLVLDL